MHDAARDFRDFLLRNKEIPLADICQSAALRRDHYEERLAIAATTVDHVHRLLDDFLEGRQRPGIARSRASRDAESVAFVCPGQGSQWVGMGTSIFRENAVFRTALEECEERIQHYAGWSLLEQLSAAEKDSKLAHTEYAQPAIFAIEVALARLWKSWGVKASVVIGHSAGEVVAAHLAGILSLDEAARVIVHRGRLMQSATGLGRMAVVGLPAAIVAKNLAGSGSRVVIAAINSPVSTVISGSSERVNALITMWRDRGVTSALLPVNYAFHSSQVQPCSEELESVLGPVETCEGSLPMIFDWVTGRAVSGEELNAGYWARNVRLPVRFAGAIETALSTGLKTFVEVGPHSVLLTSVGECQKSEHGPLCLVPCCCRNQDEKMTLLASLGMLYAAGSPVAWQAVYPEFAPAVRLPTYPYQRQEFRLAAAYLPAEQAAPADRDAPTLAIPPRPGL